MNYLANPDNLLVICTLGAALFAYLIARLLNTAKTSALLTKCTDLEADKLKVAEELKAYQNELGELRQKIGSLESASTYQLELIKQKENDLVKSESILKERFENFTNQLLETKTHHLREESERSINILLDPLKEKIQDFQKRVEETYSNEARERFSLQNQVERLLKENQRISDEANNLTKALRGDTKAQGNWGELVLKRVLEVAGLREGEEYVLQAKDLRLKTDEGADLRPDVIILLPDGKKVVIDSKVSLKSYERYIAAESSDEKKKASTEFVNSIDRHINDLHSKRYDKLNGMDSPDFVMMFCPSEGAFALAIESDEELLVRAFAKNIVPVSPTNLLAVLKTVASLWRLEKQGKNVKKIADESGKLYDKFVDFLKDFDKIKDKIQALDSTYNDALNKLSTGRGNIVGRVEKLKTLGASASKPMPENFKTELLEEIEEA